MSENYDYVIVGAGTAGCVLANRLTASSRYSVCILEAGPMDRHPLIHIPAGFVYTVRDKRVNWLYQSEPCDNILGRQTSQPRGKVVGGSGSINGHIFNRGQASDYDGWQARGNPGWGYQDVLPYFKKLETYHGDGDPEYRGNSGPFQVTDLDWQHPLIDKFIEAANSIGIPTNSDYNGADQTGIACAQRSIYKGLRMSPAKAYLHPARKKGKVDLRTHCLIDRILFDGDRATGVRYVQDGRTKTVKANKEVIISAGVFNSPQLLQLSGIGPHHLLNSMGIEVIADLPGVGENLRDHCYAPVSVKVKNVRSLNERAQGVSLLKEVIQYAFTRKGVPAMQPSLVYASWKSDPQLPSNDIQISYSPASYDANKDMKLNPYPGATCAPWQHNPNSKGFVKIRSSEIQDSPIIQMNWLDDETDKKVLVEALKLSRRICQEAPFAEFYDCEDQPGDPVQTDEEWLAYAKENASTTYHPVGTCRMGPDSDKSAVVDHQLRVKGVRGLRVVDASIMPRVPSGNTNAATLMLAEKGADMILNDNQ